MKHFSKFDVTGLGSLAVDFIATVENWPAAGTKNAMRDFDIYDGGLTGTAMVSVARLGGSAAFIGKRGNSEMSERSFQSLENEGVDLSMVSHDPESEPIIAIVFSSPEEKERNIFFKKENLKFPYPSEILDRYWFRKTRVFFTDHVAGEAGVEAARIALEAGVEVVVDIERKQENTDDLLYYSSHVVVGEKFATEYSGSRNFSDHVKALQKRDFQTIIVTRGENGAICKINEQTLAVPGFKVPVRDTTGCGDVFHGAYALFIAKKYPIERSVFLANAAAAIKAGHKGGRPGIPKKKDLDEFLVKRKVFTDFG